MTTDYFIPGEEAVTNTGSASVPLPCIMRLLPGTVWNHTSSKIREWTISIPLSWLCETAGTAADLPIITLWQR